MWDKANTVAPEILLGDSARAGTLDKARFEYETWRMTTAMINPPGPWEELPAEIRVAMCAIASGIGQSAQDAMPSTKAFTTNDQSGDWSDMTKAAFPDLPYAAPAAASVSAEARAAVRRMDADTRTDQQKLEDAVANALDTRLGGQ